MLIAAALGAVRFFRRRRRPPAIVADCFFADFHITRFSDQFAADFRLHDAFADACFAISPPPLSMLSPIARFFRRRRADANLLLPLRMMSAVSTRVRQAFRR